MREKAILCAAVFVIIFLVSAGMPAVGAQSASQYAIKINRVVGIGSWGLVTINDTVSVRNDSTLPLGNVTIGFPRNFATGLKYLGANDDQKRTLKIDFDIGSPSETYWYNVNFARTLAYNQTYKFTVTHVFTNVLLPAPGGFQYRFVATPTLRVTGSENMTIIGGADAKFGVPKALNLTESSVEGQVYLRGYFAPIEPLTTNPIVLNMTSAAQSIVRVPQLSREIRFDSDGRILVSDTYSFENLAGSLSSIQLTLPQNSSEIMAYDIIGQLWDSPENGPGITVSPRYSGGIQANRTFTFTVKYQIDPQTYVTPDQSSIANSYKFALFSNVKPWVIDKVETTIVVPAGFKVRDMSPSPLSTSGSLSYHELKFESTDATPYTDLGLTLKYNYPAFWAGSLLLSWVTLIELVVAASVLVVRKRKPAELKIPVPAEKLRQFVELYDGRTALRLELDRMAEDLARGALNKHEYRRRRKAIETRMSELDRMLQPLKQDLKTIHPRYGEMILGMEKAEAEIEANRLGEEHFKTQYRAGRISKEAYDRALADLNRRIDKAREIIDTGLVTLREEAR